MDMGRRGRLHLVTGKGGVGKLTVSAALALVLADRGARVLAVELARAGGLSRILGAAPEAPGIAVPTPAGVPLMIVDGPAALAEYLTGFVHLGGLAGAVIDHPLYQAFVGAAPGVRELMTTGKLVRDELRHRKPPWDAVVVDAGASGHSLQLLRMPAATARAFRSGLVHREAAHIDDVLRDPGTTAVHVVATPEEMPLREAATVIATVRALSVPVGALIVNRCRPTPPPSVPAALALRPDVTAQPGTEVDALRALFSRELAWAERQEVGIAGLEHETGLPAHRLPRLATAAIGPDHARALAPALAEVLP